MRRFVGWSVIAALTLSACGPSSSPAPAPKPLVVASFYPLWEFAKHVAGPYAEVVSLVPQGVEPHDWEPSPQDVARIERAKVFIMNGAGFDTWAEKLLANARPGARVVVTATEGIDLLRVDLPAHRHDDKHAGGGAVKSTGKPDPADDKGEPDPHGWTDPVLAQALVERIRSGLAKADPPHASDFEANAKAYAAKLAALHGEFERGLADCARRDIVVSHAAFAYLAKRYRLTQVPVMGLAPEAEPSPAELARIVRFARRQKVKHIFFETLVSPKLAQTLAREVGAKSLVLNPVEGLTKDEAAAGADYVSVMRKNLENLRIALECR
jgi:zinc transport system substrate-binding protein